MPSRKIEEQLEALTAMKRRALNAESNALLRKSLADPLGLIIAKAAEVVLAWRETELIPEMLHAYDKLFESGPKRDSQCSGKLAIARALREFDYSESAPFVRGLQYHQWEPVWGTETDTAGPLRSTCSLALLQCNDLLREDKLWHLTRALTDELATVRLDVLRALEEMAGRESVLLLRLKARMGDVEPGVTGQVLESLLNLEGTAGISFVSEFVYQRGRESRDEETMELAALALGASRLPEALNLLIDCWKQRASVRLPAEIILRALSSSRQEQALDFLTGIIRSGRQFEAVGAIEALALHQTSESIRALVRTAVDERDDPEITAAFQKTFQ